MIGQLCRDVIQRWKEEMARTMTEMMTREGEVAQEQNHMIEGLSTSLANLIQINSDHSEAFYRFVASSSPALDKMKTWSLDWQQRIFQTMNQGYQQTQYDIGSVREQIKITENLMIEGFDRQWECDGRISVRPDTTTPTTRTITTPTTTTTTTTTTTRTTTSTTSTTTVEIITTSLTPVITTVSYDDPEDSSDSSDCWEEKQKYPGSRSGVFQFRGDGRPRLCDHTTDGGGWTVIQQRGSFPGGPQVNFSTGWEQYRAGFGDVRGEFWAGNDLISQLTALTATQLRVQLTAHNGSTAFAEYSTFR